MLPFPHMKAEIPTTYEPKDHEDAIYRVWETSGFFNPDSTESTETYCNVLPPPNANGELHLGHASGYTVMDIFGRFQRMQGKKTLLLPGKDHAGIQTQVVFEKKLHTEREISRHDLGRDQFFKECYDFCIDRSQYMRSQEKRLGLSADWSRETFTLDPHVSRRALETFVKMYEDGMIYRDERIINWCPRCATALSDIEVIHKETGGKLFFLKYPLKDSSEFITVATTRPETMLGDTAVAVHPNDPRYQSLVGKTAILPLVGREIPIIADNRIDQHFGTGAVKITPAHDPLDWDIGKTHRLPIIQVIGTDSKITEAGKNFQGLFVEDARARVLEVLEKEGSLLKTEPHTINLSSCERCKTPIEFLVSKQWFVNVDASRYSLKKKSIEALEKNEIVFHPENMKSQMIRWLDNLHDWCISRQLWWGHRIPVWYCTRSTDNNQQTIKKCTEPIISIEPITECPQCGGSVEQDPDTLDTWFSSGQWPYTALGYPEGNDARTFYPTDTMIMGRDLLFFWATKMVLFGLYTTKKAPFKDLYFTGLVRDKDGLKMSKSKGNGIDVLHMIDQFGADAVRLSLTIGATPGLDFRLYQEKIQTFRNFTNKLWNIGRYVVQQQSAISNRQSTTKEENKLEPKSDADLWILSRLNETVREVTRLLENYQFSLAGETLRDFTWNEFADWYVEIHKIEKNTAVLRYVFETILKLWHPFMPFVTEALWKQLDKETLLMIEPWPEDIFRELREKTGGDISGSSAESFEFFIREPIETIRAVRSDRNIPVSALSSLFIRETKNDGLETLENIRKVLEENVPIFKRLARVKSIRFDAPTGTGIPVSFRHFSGELVFENTEYGKADTAKERARLELEISEIEKHIENFSTRLAHTEFRKKAPPSIIENTEKLLAESRQKHESLKASLTELSKG